jgi:Mg2+-importing ATPase
LGEGINDAPALKMANVGIAVEGASDVSREVSDLVLTQKDLRVLVRGIQRGRTIFSNINKYIKCALASNFGNFYSIAIISLFIDFLPMLPVQILLGNLLSDFPLITIATDAVDPEELKRPKQNQLKSVVPLIITLALVSTTFDFIFFAIFRHAQPAVMQTLWFLESILTEIALIFSIRTSHFFLKAKRPSWPLIALTIVDALFIIILPFTGFGQQAFHFTNPPYALVLLVLLLVTAYFFSSEAVKLIYFRFFWPWKNGNHKPKPPLIHSLAKQLAGPASSS